MRLRWLMIKLALNHRPSWAIWFTLNPFLRSCCPKEFDVVRSEADVLQSTHHPRLGVAAQTTQPIDKVRHLVALMRRRFPQSEVRFIDTVCQPTKQRQAAAIELARQADVVVVIGGA